MDDLALLDLLECPVCFEKLDATAKVLPCQHTFCKPCLQRILKSQKELRCPECRTLVLCGIEQLPSNLLLIRLLDGVRCGQNVTRFGSIQRSGVLSSPASIRRVPRGLQLHQHRLATNPRIHMEGVPRAKALYTYRGHNPGELRFNKGDIIVLLRQLDENWYLGEVNGISGVFPASSVQVIKHLPLPAPLGRALYSFDLRSRDKTDSKDSLAFHKPNTTARQLLQTSKSHWSPQFKCASLRTASPKAKGADSPAFPKVPDSRRKSLRPFSITTALNTLNRMVHAPAERPALEISSPVLISSSNPTVATQSSEKAEFPYGTPLQVSASYYPVPGSLGHSAAIVTLPHLQHHISAYMCVALHSYVAHGPEELELQKGEGVRVFGKDHDGWLRGMSLVTGRVGIFPSNYVAPLFRKTNLSDSKMPSLYASWTLSTSSLSSQGSISENGPRQSRPLNPALLPVPVPSPGRSAVAAGQASLRRGRGSTRKNGSLQRPGQAGTPVQVAGSLRRPPTAAGRPQQFQLYQHVSPQPHSIPPGAGMAEAGTRLSFSHDASPALVVRGGESRSPSVCSSVILDAKDPPAKSEAAPKPPASAPPSILVKPDTSRNSAEKQVKTVRFQNHSPPPPKRHSLQPSPSLPRGRTEPLAPAEVLLPEAGLPGPELAVLYSPRTSSSPLHQRRALHPKALSLDLSGQLTFPAKKNYSSVSAN
ncbi:E3 ubiquitin-protein ligase SH3RF2 [Tyto alba]|uniref:E3 ubiquitin-protein ligase SH3RF2 n=1 Tax=Tyto alba TaxID=56313 RepID=UPI001C66B258|nr:E3 ubiquitin-protein ligase SH3RF2 [Tyto alba]XP_042646347.1 E3 ubiquitin-protein ligase SH3RF2 [Tyto alba]XP_042646348.1 E3 ubiquitin-protein ligase SH3RF2 [Tyto alba]